MTPQSINLFGRLRLKILLLLSVKSRGKSIIHVLTCCDSFIVLFLTSSFHAALLAATSASAVVVAVIVIENPALVAMMSLKRSYNHAHISSESPSCTYRSER